VDGVESFLQPGIDRALIDDGGRWKRPCRQESIHHRALDFNPALRPAGLWIGAVAMPSGGQEQKHHARAHAAAAGRAGFQPARAFGNEHDLERVEHPSVRPVECVIFRVGSGRIRGSRPDAGVSGRRHAEAPELHVRRGGKVAEVVAGR
jgi:hypothetical protein